jgi:hypothetical protein
MSTDGELLKAADGRSPAIVTVGSAPLCGAFRRGGIVVRREYEAHGRVKVLIVCRKCGIERARFRKAIKGQALAACGYR